jgi:histidinol-phosphate/aromatic aminotransferase/cobyric acid decarboxylase-like protein
VSFPLADWIDAHEGVPHDLGASGMRGQLESTLRLLAGPPMADPDPQQLREELGRRLGVDPKRVFLTHGASEANGLVLFFLSKATRQRTGKTPTARIVMPEYPPLFDGADLAGFSPAPAGRADLVIRSEPNNPTGLRLDDASLDRLTEDHPRCLLDETFREFGTHRSRAADDRTGRWVTGTFTKAFAADSIRVGWIAPPSEETEAFRRFHGLLTDKVPEISVAYALDLLTNANEVLGEAREIFRTNLKLLRSALPEVGELEAPLAFDRPGIDETRPFASRCLGSGVLVSPGDFFGDPSGVRIGLTRRNFPDSLALYLRLREEVANRSKARTPAPAAPVRSAAGRAPPASKKPAAKPSKGRASH